MKVIEALEKKWKGKDLADRLRKEVRVRALKKLEHVRDLFPNFTDHSIRHGEGVITILDWLIPDSIKKQLNEWELYFLVAAAYLHDIGMVEGCPGTPEGQDWEEFYSKYKEKIKQLGKKEDESEILINAKREFIRDRHHLRSQEYIKNNWKELDLRESDTPAEGSIVARIAFGHREVDLGDRSLFGEIPFGNKLIRRDILAAYLRIADELDTTAWRTPWAEFEVVQLYDETSAIEWAKHMSISGVYPEAGTIVIAGECRDHKIFLRLNRLKEDLKNKLAELKRMIKRPYATGDGFFVDDPIPYNDIDLRIEPIGYLPIDIKFQLQDQEIAKLIMGERLYGDETACIRELLQNAVDTCKEAKEQRPSNWVCKLSLREENEGKIIVMEDNGIGMNEYIIREYFSKVGISYYKSSDFKGNFKPVSEFGIGFLSCFMIADIIEVDSLRSGSEPIQIEIHSLTESFIPRKGTRTEPGTTVRLHLKPNMIGQIDLYEKVKNYARHVEFNIEIITKDGEIYTYKDKGLFPDYEDLLRNIKKEHKAGFERAWPYIKKKLIKVKLESKGINVGVTLLDELARRWWIETEEIGGEYIGNSDSRGRIFQEGFFIGNFDIEFTNFGSCTWSEVNLKEQTRFDLTADRNRIALKNEEIWRNISDLHSKALEIIYNKYYSQTVKNWWSYHFNHYPNDMKYVPKALKRSARDNMEICTFGIEGFKNKTIDEINNYKGKIYWINKENHFELSIFRSIIKEDMILLICPSYLYYNEKTGEKDRYWWDELIERNIEGKEKELLADLGVTFERINIDRKKRYFLSTNKCLKKWRFHTQWAHGGSEYWGETVYDKSDPFSQIIIKWCKDNLPQNSHLALMEIFRNAHNWKYNILQEKQKEVIITLKNEGVIPQNTEFKPAEYKEVDSHDCPYYV